MRLLNGQELASQKRRDREPYLYELRARPRRLQAVASFQAERINSPLFRGVLGAGKQRLKIGTLTQRLEFGLRREIPKLLRFLVLRSLQEGNRLIAVGLADAITFVGANATRWRLMLQPGMLCSAAASHCSRIH